MLDERKWTFYNAVCIKSDKLALIKSDTTTWNVGMETSPVSLMMGLDHFARRCISMNSTNGEES